MPNPTLYDHLGFTTDTAPLQFLGEAGFLWSYLGRWKEAADVFNTLVALVPNDPTAYLGLAEVHLMQNQYPQAQKLAEQSARAAITRPNPSAVDRGTAARAYVVAGKALLHMNKPQEAKQSFLKSMELDPNGRSGRHASDMVEYGQAVGAIQTGGK